jgi:hypothetical protein
MRNDIHSLVCSSICWCLQHKTPVTTSYTTLLSVAPTACLPAVSQGKGHSSGRLFWGGVKEFADGSLGSRTALMWEPYSDDPGSSGTRTVDMAQLRERAVKADAAGLQVCRPGQCLGVVMGSAGSYVQTAPAVATAFACCKE